MNTIEYRIDKVKVTKHAGTFEREVTRWIVSRKVGEGAFVELKMPGSTRRVWEHHSESSARDAVEGQVAADGSACSRLGLRLRCVRSGGSSTDSVAYSICVVAEAA